MHFYHFPDAPCSQRYVNAHYDERVASPFFHATFVNLPTKVQEVSVNQIGKKVSLRLISSYDHTIIFGRGMIYAEFTTVPFRLGQLSENGSKKVSASPDISRECAP